MKPLALTIVLLGAVAASAEEPHWYDKVQVSGYVDTYFAWNTNAPSSRNNFFDTIGTAAKKHDELTLNLAAIDISVVSPVILHLTLNYGTATEVLHANEPAEDFGGPDVWKFVQQAYVGYKLPIGRGLTLEGGIFPSHIGFEQFATKDNWNYTHTYMADLTPFYEAGVRATYPVTDTLTLQLLYLNGWQLIGEDNSWKTFGTATVWTPSWGTLSLNTLIGPEQPNDHDHWRFFFDAIAEWNVSARWKLAATVDYGTEMLATGGMGNWVGAAAYARMQILRWLAVTLRPEVYWDGLGAQVPRSMTGLRQLLAAATLTVEARAASMLIFKVEGRFDQSSEAVFDTHSREPLTNAPLGTNRQGLVLASAVAYF